MTAACLVEREPENLVGTKWRHKRRGMVYEVLFDRAFIQCSAAPEVEERFDGDSWIIYQNVNTKAVYFRPREEFADGRFERLPE
jgi:hypothetical protein